MPFSSTSANSGPVTRPQNKVVTFVFCAVVSEYIDGTKDKRYDFVLRACYRLSDTTDVVNTDVMGELRRFQTWIEEQAEIGNFPSFGSSCEIYNLENLSDGPLLALVEENGMATYQCPARLSYEERR